MTAERPVTSAIVDAKTFLGMSRVDEDTWSFEVTERLITPGQFLFGGCGLASGLVALEEASGRPTIWATAQYLSYAPLGATVTVKTDLAVVGNRVTQARATARTSSGREILTVNAALGTGELSSPTPWVTMPDVARARGLSSPGDAQALRQLDLQPRREPRIALGRSFERDRRHARDRRSRHSGRGCPGHFDPSAATLAIFGDYVSGGATQPLGYNTMGRSLDNTIRIASLVPTEWVLLRDPHARAAGGFAQGTAFLWSRTGPCSPPPASRSPRKTLGDVRARRAFAALV